MSSVQVGGSGSFGLGLRDGVQAGGWLPRRSLNSSVSTASLLPLQCPLGGAAQPKWGEAGFLPASPGSGSGWGGRRAELELSVSLPGCPRRRA